MNHDGELEYSEVLMFLDRDQSATVAFYTLHTTGGRNVTLTPSHLIHVADSRDTHQNKATPVFAQDVRVGQYIFTRSTDSHDSHMIQISQVARISMRTVRGYYAPLTKHGTIVVDDVIASCYARINSQTIAHFAFAPVRMLKYISEMLLDNEHPHIDFLLDRNYNQHGGVHWYAGWLQRIADVIIPDYQWFKL